MSKKNEYTLRLKMGITDESRKQVLDAVNNISEITKVEAIFPNAKSDTRISLLYVIHTEGNDKKALEAIAALEGVAGVNMPEEKKTSGDKVAKKKVAKK